MKKLHIALLFGGLIALTTPSLTTAQENKPLAAVLNIDTKGINYDPIQMGNLVRIELEKLDQYRMMDRYDIEYIIEKNQLVIENCYGSICLSGVGKVLGLDLILAGTVELAGDMMIVQFRIIDVKNETLKRTITSQYLNIPKEIPEMVRITLAELYNVPVNEDIKRRLTRPYEFDNAINNPDIKQLRADGPRMGLTVFTNQTAKRLQELRRTGGYESEPVMFQFGYQFEKQYINEGRLQALVEVIPMITGVDQGLFIPSLTILNGFRDNLNGWEVAFGPTFGIVRISEWYQLDNGDWYQNINDAPVGSTGYYTDRLDSRGMPALSSGFVFAAGKTIKSGHMNFPINGYFIPGRNGVRFGLSFGFNARNDRASGL